MYSCSHLALDSHVSLLPYPFIRPALLYSAARCCRPSQVRKEDGNTAVKVLEDRFQQAISAGRVSAVQKIEGCCVLAAVGQVRGTGAGGERGEGGGDR